MKGLCFSIDVERDYRNDSRITTRGIAEGLPAFVEFLVSKQIPFDIFVSGEIAGALPPNFLRDLGDLVALGCHGLDHVPGVTGYLNRRSLKVQRAEIAAATELTSARLGHRPHYFRAPNFSANEQTLLVLRDLGYHADSSVLPGRLVRKLRVWTLLDQRDAPVAPYYPDENALVRPGSFPLLEVPVTPSVKEPGSPLGLGLLNDLGPDIAAGEVLQSAAPYVVFLCHSWEMVDWNAAAPVAPWVRRAATADLTKIARFVAALGDTAFVNMRDICARETKNIGFLDE